MDEVLRSDDQRQEGGAASTWVYISGPNAFIKAGEEACRERKGRGVDYYGARWDV